MVANPINKGMFWTWLIVAICLVTLFRSLRATVSTNQLALELNQFLASSENAPQDPTDLQVFKNDLEARVDATSIQVGFRGLALLSEQLEDWPGASKAWSQAGYSPESLNLWAKIYLKNGYYTLANRRLLAARELDPELADTYYHLGLVEVANNSHEQAKAYFMEGLSHQRFIDTGRSDFWFELAELANQENDFDNALDGYLMAIELNNYHQTTLEQTLFQVGNLYLFGLDKPASSVGYFEDVVHLNPHNHWAWLRRGTAAFQADGNYDLAISSIEKAIEEWPDDAYRKWPYRYLAEINISAGYVKVGCDYFRQVIAIDPTDEQGLFYLNDSNSCQN